MAEISPTFSPVSQEMRVAFARIFTSPSTSDPLGPSYFSDVSKLTFTASSGTGDIAVGSYNYKTARGFCPGPNAGRDIWLGPNIKPAAPGTYDNWVLLHEIGYALGLEHDNAYPGGGTTTAPDLPANLDNLKYTIMSYTPPDARGMYPVGLQQFDIAALQQIIIGLIRSRSTNEKSISV